MKDIPGSLLGPVKIGNLYLHNNLFLAPMAGVTNLPFRLIARECGCSMAFTEMVSANGLVRGALRTRAYLETTEGDDPLGVQIFGSVPDIMAEAARMVSACGARLIDINMGCPVKKVVRTGAGAALLRDPERIKAVLGAVRKATTLPLTVKIRSGWSRREIVAPIIGAIAQDCGVDALIIHPRTADQGFSGNADWSVIRQMKEMLHIPVIGNGDIRTPSDILKMLGDTGCDGVMIGRSCLGNPWIFRDAIHAGGESRNIFSKDRWQVVMRHFALEKAYSGRGKVVAVFRKHLLWYTKGLPGGAKLRERLSRLTDEEALRKALEEFAKGIDAFVY